MVWGTSISLSAAIGQATDLLTKSYAIKVTDMTDSRMQSWFKKTSKARKTAPAVKALPPTRGLC